MTKCEYYPEDGDDRHGGVCYAGSELGGSFVCTVEYGLDCEARLEADAREDEKIRENGDIS